MAAPRQAAVASQATAIRTVVAAVGVTSLGVLPVWLLGGLAVQIGEDLAFSESELGIAVAIYFTVSALVSVQGGRFVERVGWVRGITLTAAVAATALGGVALGARTWWWLVAIVSIGALANAMSQPAANLGLARVVRPHRQGVAFGIKQAAMPLTTLVAGLAVPLVGATIGWRWAFGIAGLLALSVAGLPPRRGLGPTARPHPPARARRERVRRAGDAATGPLLVLAVGAGLGNAATNSLGGFFVVFAVTEGLSPQAAGYLLGGASAVGIASRILVGHIADRMGRGHLVIVAAMMLGGALGLGLLAVRPSGPILVVGTALAFGLGWSWNGLFAFAVVRHNARAPAAATGVVQTTKFVGGTAGPLAFGFVAERLSYVIAWGGSAAAIAAGALFVLVGRLLLRDNRGGGRASG